ncbi:hypothetical protein C8Q76DRAFT_695799 [Earliella scabrosa]|nr:hypothetical protein C8Q76DRAFT_695799 [Earliella scabrosa]
MEKELPVREAKAKAESRGGKRINSRRARRLSSRDTRRCPVWSRSAISPHSERNAFVHVDGFNVCETRWRPSSSSAVMAPAISNAFPPSRLHRRTRKVVPEGLTLPNESSKPEWKFDGAVIKIPELPLNLLVSTHTSSTVGASKIRLSYGGKLLMNSQSIAVYNLEDEDFVVAAVCDGKEKKQRNLQSALLLSPLVLGHRSLVVMLDSSAIEGAESQH